MVGARSVVTKDVAPDTLVAGVPATVRRRLNQDGNGGEAETLSAPKPPDGEAQIEEMELTGK